MLWKLWQHSKVLVVPLIICVLLCFTLIQIHQTTANRFARGITKREFLTDFVGQQLKISSPSLAYHHVVDDLTELNNFWWFPIYLVMKARFWWSGKNNSRRPTNFQFSWNPLCDLCRNRSHSMSSNFNLGKFIVVTQSSCLRTLHELHVCF